MRIIAIDPGGTCGLASWVGGHSFTSREYTPHAAISYVDMATQTWSTVDLIVCESFIPRPGVRTNQPDALETIGALRYLSTKCLIPFQLQSPADAKLFSTNVKLEEMGWRKPTAGGHADDAARHLLLAAVKHGAIDPARFIQ